MKVADTNFVWAGVSLDEIDAAYELLRPLATAPVVITSFWTRVVGPDAVPTASPSPQR